MKPPWFLMHLGASAIWSLIASFTSLTGFLLYRLPASHTWNSWQRQSAWARAVAFSQEVFCPETFWPEKFCLGIFCLEIFYPNLKKVSKKSFWLIMSGGILSRWIMDSWIASRTRWPEDFFLVVFCIFPNQHTFIKSLLCGPWESEKNYPNWLVFMKTYCHHQIFGWVSVNVIIFKVKV